MGGAGFPSDAGLIWDYIKIAQGSAQLPNPAAGSEFTLTVPNNSLWELITVSYTLTCSGTVASRVTGLQVLSSIIGDGRYQWYLNGQVLPAGNIANCFCSVGVVQFAQTQNRLQGPMPPKIMLTDGYRLKSNTVNLDGGDQFSNVQAVFRAYKTLKKVSFT